MKINQDDPKGKEYVTFIHEYVDHQGTKKTLTHVMDSTFLTLEEYILFFEECLAGIGFVGVQLDLKDTDEDLPNDAS
jgi:hypothetical protein